MNKLKEWVRPILAVGTLVSAITLVFMGQQVPDWLVGAATGFATWWFRSRDEEKKNSK